MKILTDDQLNEKADQAEEILEDQIQRIVKEKNLDFLNIIKRLDDAREYFKNISFDCSFQSIISKNELSENLSDELNLSLIRLLLNKNLANKVFEYYQTKFKTEHKKLSKQDIELTNAYVKMFIFYGMKLGPSKIDKLSKIRHKIIKLSGEFQQNLNDIKTKLFMDKDQLKGLPASFYKNRPYNRDTKYTIYLKPGDYNQIISFAKEASTRKHLHKFWRQRAPENSKIMIKLLNLRAEEAKIVGFNSHSEYILKYNSLAGSPEKVIKFLKHILSAIDLKVKNHISWLNKFSLAYQGKSHESNFPEQDLSYYNQILIKDLYSIDMAKINEKLSVDKVLTVMLEFYEYLFSVQFEQIKTYTDNYSQEYINYTISKEIKGVYLYNVLQDNKKIGTFYLDLYSRDNKYGHFAAFSASRRFVTADGEEIYPKCIVLANFNQSGQITLGEMRILFHEFGHVMHEMFSNQEHAGLSGIESVEFDFIESVSQMMEFFAVENFILKKLGFSGAEIEKIRKLYSIEEAFTTAQMSAMSLFDVEMYNKNTVELAAFNTNKLANYYKKLMLDLAKIELPDYANPVNTFEHMAGDYSSRYYGYIWSRCLAHEMYSVFLDKKTQELKYDRLPELGQKFIKQVLAPSGSIKSAIAVKKFTGKTELTTEAFIEKIGGKKLPNIFILS